MARSEIFHVVQYPSGAAVGGASVLVRDRATLATSTVYVAETGGTTRSNPLTTDSNGRIEGWLENGSYDLVVTPPVGVAYVQAYEAFSGATSITQPITETPGSFADLFCTIPPGEWVGNCGTTANATAYFRARSPKTGTLRDIALYFQSTGGTCQAALYTSAAGTLTRVWASGNVATPAIDAWRIVGDPNLAVTAGAVYYVAFSDTAGLSLRGMVRPAALDAILPANFLQLGSVGGRPIMNGTVAGTNCPATQADSALVQNQSFYAIIGRIT